MSDTSVRQAEIAVEQRHVDQVYARLVELRAEAKSMRAQGYELGHGAEREATFERATMLLERDVMVRHAERLLRSLDTEHEGLVFGRLDLADGQTLYIGRLGVRGAQFENLVTDWRAPAAAAFYQATAEQPMGVLRRRVIRCQGETVIDIDDDLLTPSQLPDEIKVVGEGALMATLGRARGDTMRDIVATIQREQDEAIRAPMGGVTEIVGGPGTGKTAVALHRAAYLLYRERRRMGGTGVLVVGPSPVFTSYISRVLPSMGEDAVDLRALGEVLDGVSATHTDPGPVSAIKGSLRMRRVLLRALREAPPGAPTELRIVYGGEVLKLGPKDLDAVRWQVHRKGGLPNAARIRAAETLLEALWHKAEQYADDRFRPKRDDLITELGERMDFHRFLVVWWAPLTPAGVLGWLRDRERLAAAARRILTAAEIDLLAQSWADESAGWSVADTALLDELRVLLGEPPKRRRPRPTLESQLELRTWAERSAEPRHQRADHYDEYSHVVIDESQDLSPMQWRMIGRRGKYASWTIVGDPEQTSWPDPEGAAKAKDTALRSARGRREFALRTNYRNSAEIFALAARSLGPLADPDRLPRAVRSTGIEPEVRTVGADGLAAATKAAALELLSTVDGTVGVITAMDRTPVAAKWLAEVTDERLRVVGSLDAKGLEYDAVVVVAPAELVAESVTGRRALYVALTRATQQLIVVSADPEAAWLF